jgi:hypothetical protein
LPQSAYCKSVGLPYSTFKASRRQLHSANGEHSEALIDDAAKKGLPAIPRQFHDATAVNFIPAHIRPQTNMSGTIELRSPTGWQVRIDSAQSAFGVESVLRLLEQFA